MPRADVVPDARDRSAEAKPSPQAADARMPVVMLSKALVVGTYQRKAELIATYPDVALTVVAPEAWHEGGQPRPLERSFTRGYELVTTRVRRNGDFHLHYYPDLDRILSHVSPRLLHVDEEPYNLATAHAVFAARRRHARAVFFTWQNLHRRYPPPFSLFERYVYSRSSAAIAGTYAAGRVLVAKGYRGKLWVLPQFGVDTDTFRPAIDPPVRPFTVGFVGRLVPAKGVDLAVRAVAALGDGARLVVAGEGPDAGPLEELAARLGAADRVSFLGWLGSGELVAFYQGLDALVLPSRTTASWAEQFGRVLIEAMACQVACVGSRSGEIPEVLGEAGLLVPEGDADALEAALRRLRREAGLAERLGRLGRERVIARYAMEHIARQTVAIYRTVGGGAAAAAR